MPAVGRHASRSVIGNSNRSDPMPTVSAVAPSTPGALAPSAAGPTGQTSSTGSLTYMMSTADLRKLRGSLAPAGTTPAPAPSAATPSIRTRVLHGSSADFDASKLRGGGRLEEAVTNSGKTLSGHQETSLGIMTDFFAKRPMVQMRNAFRDADGDGSGELDIEEFQQAVRNMNTKLTDKDARAIFQIADEDGSGTLGIDEFLINFRSDAWPRERFFWSKQCGGGANLTKAERLALAEKLRKEQQSRAKRSTGEIMKVLEDKVARHGSAQKIFQVLDSNFNGSLEVDEIADAIRPYEIDIDDRQAAEVLAEINRVAGKAADTPLTYESFALAFNSRLPPSRMGSVAFQPPRPSELVRRREPTDNQHRADNGYPSLGEVRTLSQADLHMRRSHETIDYMRSLATIRPRPPLDHSASMASLSDQVREAEFAQLERHDQMGAWRGVDGTGNEAGGQMGKEIMKTGRDIDWTSFTKPKSPSLYGVAKSASTPQLHALTPLERNASNAMASAGGAAA